MYDKESREALARKAVKELHAAMPHLYRGFHVDPTCCETVIGALQTVTYFKMDRLEDVTMGLGAGVSEQGELCGAVSGHIIAIGLDVVSRIRDVARIRFEIFTETRKFCARFREKYGSIRCKDLIGYSLSDPVEVEQYMADQEKLNLCDEVIEFAIKEPLPSELETAKKVILGL